ncbi:MAG: universal stress protein [Granulosicoccus sp.]|nr:universal stress protein [Granulosicoccus sp.]
MSYQTIIVYLDNQNHASKLLESAASIAHRHNAHLVGLYVVPPLHFYVSSEVPLPVEMIDHHQGYHRSLSEALHAQFETVVARHGIKAEWREIDAENRSVADSISEMARTADLIVMQQRDTSAGDAELSGLPEGVVLNCGRPVLLVPINGSAESVDSDVLVAWDGSSESTRAVFDALPLLQKAGLVTVHQINTAEEDRHRLLSHPAELVSTLSRHGVNATLSHSDARNGDVGGELIAVARDNRASLLVMGAYGRSRFSELLFGGATRTVLRSMTFPVLFSH